MTQPASKGKTRIDGLILDEGKARTIEEEAKERGFPLRTYLRALVLRGARAEGLEV